VFFFFGFLGRFLLFFSWFFFCLCLFLWHGSPGANVEPPEPSPPIHHVPLFADRPTHPTQLCTPPTKGVSLPLTSRSINFWSAQGSGHTERTFVLFGPTSPEAFSRLYLPQREHFEVHVVEKVPDFEMSSQPTCFAQS